MSIAEMLSERAERKQKIREIESAMRNFSGDYSDIKAAIAAAEGFNKTHRIKINAQSYRERTKTLSFSDADQFYFP